jgi:4-amino-4-deoxy-L-arabinose transferase-like glycosyltransferase
MIALNPKFRSPAAAQAEGPATRSLGGDPWRATLLLVGLFTLVRLAALFATPLELYPDEAQYWMWSRHLDWGYWSKPPMIAWLIALTTGIGGNAEPWVRISSLLLHAGAALAVYRAGARLCDGRAGFWAALLYSLMPGVQLSSGIVSTDAPLLFFLALALWAYAALLRESAARARALAALGLGAALGLAFLSKYAALYFVIGMALHLAFDRTARAAWRPAAAAAAVAAFALVIAPNLLWNAAHGFETVAHTASNADWGAKKLFNPASLGNFLVAQFGVFGPIPFAALLLGLGVAVRRRTLSADDRLLLCLAAPPLIAVTVQAFISRANANWAAAAYVPASVLVAAWLLRWNARGWRIGAVASQALIAAVFVAAAVSPALAERAGMANSFKRAKGWAETSRRVFVRVDAERAHGGLSAIAVDDRFLFNALGYYGRDRLAAPGAPPLRVWVRGVAGNQAEATAPLTPAEGRRVLVAATKVKGGLDAIAADFAATGPVQDASVGLDRKRSRPLLLFVGEGFAPKPRVSGAAPPPSPTES